MSHRTTLTKVMPQWNHPQMALHSLQEVLTPSQSPNSGTLDQGRRGLCTVHRPREFLSHQFAPIQEIRLNAQASHPTQSSRNSIGEASFLVTSGGKELIPRRLIPAMNFGGTLELIFDAVKH